MGASIPAIRITQLKEQVHGFVNVDYQTKPLVSRIIVELNKLHDWDNPIEQRIETSDPTCYKIYSYGYRDPITGTDHTTIKDLSSELITNTYYDAKLEGDKPGSIGALVVVIKRLVHSRPPPPPISSSSSRFIRSRHSRQPHVSSDPYEVPSSKQLVEPTISTPSTEESGGFFNALVSIAFAPFQ